VTAGGRASGRGRGAACCAPTFSLSGWLGVFLAVSLAAQDSTFLLTTTDPTYRTPAFLGNGAFSLVGAPLGTTPALSLVAGVYDHAPDDVPRIAALPAWNALDVSDGDGWLNDVRPDTSALRDYRQTLDLYDGTLATSYEWVHGAKRTAVEVTAFVSRADPHLAVIRLRLVRQDAGRLTVRFPLREWPPPPRLALARLERSEPRWTLDSVWYPGRLVAIAADSLSILARVGGGTTRVAVAQQLTWSARLRNPRRRGTEVSFGASPGESVTFTKLVGVASSRDGPDPLARARAVVRAAAARGYRTLAADHAAAWHRLWQTDVVVQGDPELQRVIHAMLFYLLASVREGSDESIPPMGLSSAGYYGHVFWDADTWMFPPLLALHPAISRSMVGFRYRALDAARRNAARNGYRGAMYPWESDELGEETTPRFAWQNALYENHVTGDVALAQWQYYLATGDSAWLARAGYPVLRATADFWVSRATFDSTTGRYDIHHIVSVDEGLIGIGNDTYTNAIARKNLEFALLASRRLGRAPDRKWARVAAGLYVPYDSAGEYHPTYEGAPAETRGSVVPLLAYPLGIPMSEPAKRNDLDAAVGRLLKEGSGAMMTTTLYPVIAAELGDRALVDTLLPLSYRTHLRPPFLVLAETPTNDAVNFLTGAGGFLQQVIFGYSGLRLGDSGLHAAFRPMLPSRVTRLVLRNVSIRGRAFDIIVEGDTTRLVPR
jgi:trehalose/maltose hydrolase-like predicted phosphorylase